MMGEHYQDVKIKLHARDNVFQSVVVAREHKVPGHVIIKNENEKYLIIPENCVYSARSLGFLIVEC
ncbi:hypothetical protein QA612_16700 [Evansella sp. AB-P1]|uniref:hypothetical protein n=1 Tax=Evansella sp. AB-P1 TaxID=3037653 RepID=UPI00241C2CE6|nr:hypothetical protein [Evansella sp. AB-P1]MDG5789098.1 hypothetical protein [Evansella sp. AB-P1]